MQNIIYMKKLMNDFFVVIDSHSIHHHLIIIITIINYKSSVIFCFVHSNLTLFFLLKIIIL